MTACVASRVNALGKAIPISLRAEAGLPAPQPAVSTERRYRESADGEDPSEGVLVGSFTAPLCLVGRECHWERYQVRKGAEIVHSLQGNRRQARGKDVVVRLTLCRPAHKEPVQLLEQCE